MSDQSNPVSPAQKVQIEVVGSQAPSNNSMDFQKLSPEAFNARLEEAKAAGMKQVLKGLGVKKEERAAILAQLERGDLTLAPKPKEGEPDYRSEYEKLKSVSQEAESYKAKLEKHVGFFKKLADDEFAKLPEPIQKDLVRRNIEDPEARLEEINAMRESGLLAALMAGSVPAKAEAKPATTMASSGPQANPPSSEKTPWEQYQALKASGRNDIAAYYYRAKTKAIEASKPKL